jgi:hypothetical protein
MQHRIWDKKNLRDKLIEIFGKNYVKNNHEGMLCIPCVICECEGYKLCFTHETNSVKCSSCGFHGKPIELFIDAYQENPTGFLLETDEIKVIRVRKIHLE